MANWNDLLSAAMMDCGDPGPVVAKSGSEDDWTKKFDNGYGTSEGPAVLAWTSFYVYFPVVYDGGEWLDCAPRNPQANGQPHVGGG